MKAYAFHPEAEQEFVDATEYYARINLELGNRFFDEMEALISDIRRRPQMYPPYDSNIRRHISQVFPYALLYREELDRVFIFAIANMRRRPGYWKSRMH